MRISPSRWGAVDPSAPSGILLCRLEASGLHGSVLSAEGLRYTAAFVAWSGREKVLPFYMDTSFQAQLLQVRLWRQNHVCQHSGLGAQQANSWKGALRQIVKAGRIGSLPSGPKSFSEVTQVSGPKCLACVRSETRSSASAGSGFPIRVGKSLTGKGLAQCNMRKTEKHINESPIHRLILRSLCQPRC